MLVTFMGRNYSNIMEVAECIAPLVTCTFAFIKYVFLMTHSGGVFDILKEVKEINKKCKLKCCSKFKLTPLKRKARGRWRGLKIKVVNES